MWNGAEQEQLSEEKQLVTSVTTADTAATNAAASAATSNPRERESDCWWENVLEDRFPEAPRSWAGDDECNIAQEAETEGE